MEKQEKATEKHGNATDLLANERTFLAWIRTSIAFVGLGFVVVKFSLFTRQLPYVLASKKIPHVIGVSSYTGIILVIVGGLTAVAGFLNFIQTDRRLHQQEYKTNIGLYALFFLMVLLIAAFLTAYLSQSL